VAAAAEAAPHAAPVAAAERRVEAEARHQDGQQAETHPPAAAAVAPAAALAWPLRELALLVRHAVVHHALRAEHARHLVDAPLCPVRRQLARARTVAVLRVKLQQSRKTRRHFNFRVTSEKNLIA
jgi:hypothetical protein